MKAKTMPELLTVAEAARLLRVSPITIRRHIADGQIQGVRAGRAVRVPREALGRFLRPIEPKATKFTPTRSSVKRAPAGRPLTRSDTLFKLLGMAGSAPASDSSKKHEYLAEAIARHRQGDGNS